MQSVLSFPNRGRWGKSSWRGNCSGHVYKALFEQFQPSLFCDPMVGSGTSIEVAREMGIKAVGLDLHSGFNVLRDSILQALGEHADLVVSHPPYGDMIVYSGEVWGNEAHPDDLSRCADQDDFADKLQIALLNQREATRDGGIYGTLIGDLRRNGRYYSYQADAISRMPADELCSVVIKTQHNTMSGRQSYRAMSMPYIVHEYLLLWRKPEVARCLLTTMAIMSSQLERKKHGSWRSVVRQALIGLGGPAPLEAIYEAVAATAPDRLRANQHWKPKVRQTVQRFSDFVNHDRGVWGLAQAA